MMSNVSIGRIDFDIDTPVLVVGGGACGMTAALAARDAGAETVLLERDTTPFGSTGMSQGYVCAAGTRLQREAGIEDSADRFYADIMAKTNGTADPLTARTVADQSGPTVDWLTKQHRIPFEVNRSWAGFFGHSVGRMHGVPSKTGTELLGSLTRAATEAGADIVTGAHVHHVFADEDGRVTGVAFKRLDGREERIGCGALVLATCGFGANHEMVRKYIPQFGQAANYRYHGHEGNKGEGIAWGAELGGALGSMDAFQGYGALADPHAVVANYDLVMTGGFAVNIAGERFSNEVADISGQALKVLSQPGGVGWLIYDDIRHARCTGFPEYQQLMALGAIRPASTIDELARVTGVDKVGLARSLQLVEAATQGREHCPFGRDFTGLQPLQAPYRALKVTGALFHTQGGLQTDPDARVLRPDGSSLPNLFAGGGAARGISGEGVSGYLPAAGLCTAVTLGHLAGRAAARAALR